MSKTRIYMDNCCYNRPYDDQIQARIHVESQAKLEIQNMIRMGKLELASSFVLEYENKVNPKEDRRIPIANFIDSYTMVFIASSKRPEIEEKASKFQKQGIK